MENQKPTLLVDNALIGLNKPAAVFLGLSQHKKHNVPLTADQVNTVVTAFAKHGILAAGYSTEQAENPAALLVTPTGIQSPFVPPDEVEASTEQIRQIIEKEVPELNIFGFAHPVTCEQLMDAITGDEKFNDFGTIHPHPEKAKQILKERGPDFIKNMLKEADTLPDYTLKEDKIYSGCAFPQAFLIAPQSENKAFVYGALNGKDALKFPPGKHDYVFIREFEPVGFYGTMDFDNHSDNNIKEKLPGYKNYAIEHGFSQTEKEKAFETPIYLGSYKFTKLLLKINKENGYSIKEIPLDNPKWQDFAYLHLPGYIAENHMLKRRHNLKELFSKEILQTNSLFAQMVAYENKSKPSLSNNLEKTYAEKNYLLKLLHLSKLRGTSASYLKKLLKKRKKLERQNPKTTTVSNPGNLIKKYRGLTKSANKLVRKYTIDITKLRKNDKER